MQDLGHIGVHHSSRSATTMYSNIGIGGHSASTTQQKDRPQEQDDIPGSMTYPGARIGSSSGIKKVEPSRRRYNIGWICALEVELTAARMLLDEEYEAPGNPATDNNSYVFGKMGVHNIVIACLPTGVYGKVSSASVATMMASTFPSIHTYVLVGIGGGVPQPDIDIRLGDVVVGVPTSEHPAVIQYDYGKSTLDGFEHKGSLNKPDQFLLTAVTKLRSNHRLKGDKIAVYMAEACKKYPQASEFRYPGSDQDVLNQPDCLNPEHSPNCLCSPTPIRSVRSDPRPRIHYGSIASGDTVVKNHRVRQELALKHGIICFEMEAAGLMDNLRALVVRGTSDYCNSGKTKIFQPYAALAAAAYTKELMAELAVRDPEAERAEAAHISENRQMIMGMLKSQSFNYRRGEIKEAHSETCKWLLDNPKYLEWLNSQACSSILWMKGKAGCGKSTKMKFLIEDILKTQSNEDIILSFFFSARGTAMEKSIYGLYRSLIAGLFAVEPSLQVLFDDLSLEAGVPDSHLIRLLYLALDRLGTKRRYTFCIDALDECRDDEVWEMIEFFENLAARAESKELRVRIFFASRHYPNVVITGAEYLLIDDMPGHLQDIRGYISKELKIGESSLAAEIKNKVYEGSSGVFLWACLVVAVLNKTYLRGRSHELAQRLSELPQGLHSLFRNILLRDNDNLDDLIHCLQWLLYAGRPLSSIELYYALVVDERTTTDIQIDASKSQMENMLVDASKGLIEITKDGKIQLIHESVREFLLDQKTMIELHPSFAVLDPYVSHQRLRDLCTNQLRNRAYTPEPWDQPGSSLFLDWDSSMKFGMWVNFWGYLSAYVFYHAEHCQRGTQLEFLADFDFKAWREPLGESEQARTHKHSPGCQIAIYLSNYRHHLLLEAWWKLMGITLEDMTQVVQETITDRDSLGAKITLLAYYQSHGLTHEDAHHVEPLLELMKDLEPESTIRPKIVELIIEWHERDKNLLDIAFELALECKRLAALQIIIKAGIHCTSRHLLRLVGGPTSSSVLVLEWRSQILPARRLDLISNGSLGDFAYRSTSPQLYHDAFVCVSCVVDHIDLLHMSHVEMCVIMHEAIEWTNGKILHLLRDSFAELLPSGQFQELYSGFWKSCVRISSIHYYLSFPMHHSDKLGRQKLRDKRRQILYDCAMHIDENLDQVDGEGNSLLHHAAIAGDSRTIKFLTTHGALVTVENNHKETALQLLLVRCRPALDPEEEYLKSTSQLPASKMDPYYADGFGRSWLHLAIDAGLDDLTEMLICLGVNIEARDNNGRTALHLAARYGSVVMVETLLRYGARANVRDIDGNTPLHLALYTGRTDIIKILIHSGADLNARNTGTQTPIAWWISGRGVRSYQPVKALLAHGAELPRSSPGDHITAEAVDWLDGHRAETSETFNVAKCCELAP